MVATARPRRKKAQKGRMVALFGPRGVGVSLVVGLVSGATKHATTITTLPALQNNDLVPSADVVFVETHTADEVQALITEGFINAANEGVFVKVLPDGIAVNDPDWPDREKAIEDIIRQHNVPYHTVMNQHKDPMAACVGLAKAAQLKS